MDHGARTSSVEEAREALRRREWERACELLEGAQREGALPGEELELLAEAARWAGRSSLLLDALERAHAAYGAAGDVRGGARTALSLCHAHGDQRALESARAWLRRARELLEDAAECAEHGLLAWFEGRAAAERGDLDEHGRLAERALELGRRHGSRAVEALALLDLGQLGTARGDPRAPDWLARSTAIALSGEIGPLETGTVFCGALWFCRSTGRWSEAEEWSRTADRWCHRERLAYFPGLCRVHRAEVLRARGALAAAEDEALQASEMLAGIPRWAPLALSELGEVRRRRGDQAGALQAFQRCLEQGWDPEPGLALLLLEQEDARAAHRAITRALAGKLPTWLREDRASLLGARATIALRAGDEEDARAALAELDEHARANPLPWSRAAAAFARGELELSAGRAAEATDALLEAKRLWGELDVPYELAGAGELLAQALEAAGDARGAELERAAAQAIRERIGAAPAAARVAPSAPPVHPMHAVHAVHAVPDAPSEARLAREGDVWMLAFEGTSVRLRHTLGLAYLARLLARPEAEIPCLELAAAATGAAAPAPGGPGDVLLDPEARAAIRRRLEDLASERALARENADLGREEALAGEAEALTRELGAALGLGGRSRRTAGALERARQSVTKALRGTARRIAEVHPRLGRHLEASLRTGTFCRYAPERPVRWRVEDGGPGRFTT